MSGSNIQPKLLLFRGKLTVVITAAPKSSGSTFPRMSWGMDDTDKMHT